MITYCRFGGSCSFRLMAKRLSDTSLHLHIYKCTVPTKERNFDGHGHYKIKFCLDLSSYLTVNAQVLHYEVQYFYDVYQK